MQVQSPDFTGMKLNHSSEQGGQTMDDGSRNPPALTHIHFKLRRSIVISLSHQTLQVCS